MKSYTIVFKNIFSGAVVGFKSNYYSVSEAFRAAHKNIEKDGKKLGEGWTCCGRVRALSS